jgi:hypothetical protein
MLSKVEGAGGEENKETRGQEESRGAEEQRSWGQI